MELYIRNEKSIFINVRYSVKLRFLHFSDKLPLT